MLDNPRSERIKKVCALSGRQARKKQGLMLVEGPQAVRELLAHRADDVRDVYFTQDAAHRHERLFEMANGATRWVHMVSDEVAAKISTESQGVVAVASSQAVGPRGVCLQEVSSTGFLVALPGTQDPGNLGTIIRTADAMGARGVVLGTGTCEVTNPKVVRSSAGSVFHLPVFHMELAEVAAVAASGGSQLLGTALGDFSVALPSLVSDGALSAPHVWVFGNEARGLSPEQRELCDLLVHIPMAGLSESLNVGSAAAMCLFASSLA